MSARSLHRWRPSPDPCDREGVLWCQKCGMKKKIVAGWMMFLPKGADNWGDFRVKTPPCGNPVGDPQP